MFHRPRSCPSLTRFPQDARIGRRRPGDELSQLSPPSPFHCVSPYIMHYTAFAGNKESLASLYGLSGGPHPLLSKQAPSRRNVDGISSAL